MEMNTRLVSVKDLQADSNNIQLAADILRSGGLVALPTETVYGIAANALDEAAVSRIFAVKGRPQDNPLIVHIADTPELASLVLQVPAEALTLAEAFWPGPLTMVLHRSDMVPPTVSAGLDTVAVRMPALTAAREIIRRAGVPVAAPSANISGRPSPTTAQHCAGDLWGRIELIADGGECAVGLESTVLSLTTGTPRILRPGAVTPAQLEAVLGRGVDIDDSVLSPSDDSAPVSSPGMKYKHYAPNAAVTLLEGSTSQVMEFLARHKEDGGVWALVFEEDMPLLPVPGCSLGKAGAAEEQAFRLFAALRELDQQGAKKVYARTPDKEGVGLAVYNRLIRAAGFRKISL